MLESEYQSKTGSIRQTLFYRKVGDEAKRFVSEFMTPKNVVTKGAPFITLSNALADWMKKEHKGFIEAIESANDDEPKFSVFRLQAKRDVYFKE